MRKYIDTEEFLKYMMTTGASRKETAQHFNMAYITVVKRILEWKEKFPEKYQEYKGKIRLEVSKVTVEQMLDYMEKNRATRKQVAQHFKISEINVIKKLLLYKKQNPEQYEKQFQKASYTTEQILIYRLTHANMSIEEIAENFGISKGALNARLARYRKNNPKEYETYTKKFKRNRISEEDMLEYMLNNKVSREEVAEHFGITRNAFNQRIRKMKMKKPQVYQLYAEKIEEKEKSEKDEIKQTFNQTLEEMLEYKITNHTTIKETAEYFGITRETLEQRIRKYKKNNPEEYQIYDKKMKEEKQFTKNTSINNISRKEKLNKFCYRNNNKVKGETILKYIIENNVSLEIAAWHLGIAYDTAKQRLQQFKKEQPENLEEYKQKFIVRQKEKQQLSKYINENKELER